MKKLILPILMILLISCKESICITKDDFRKEFNTFLQEHREAFKKLSTEDKKEYNRRFNDMVETCYKKHKPEMTLKERQYFWKDALVFLAKNNAESDGENFNFTAESAELDDYIQSEFEAVIKESGQDFAQNVKQIIAEELPKIVDDVMEEVEKVGEELKEALKNINVETEDQ